MQQVVELNGSGKVEFMEEGVRVIYASGEKVCFDNDGNVLPKEKVMPEKPDWLEHFFFMGEQEREVVKLWLDSVWPNDKWLRYIGVKTARQAEFLQIVEEALTRIDFDYWIAAIEPTMDDSKRIIYKPGEKVANHISPRNWVKYAKEFAPEWKSYLATINQLFLWYAYRIAKGLWSLEYVCDDSSKAGNYWYSPNAAHELEVSGKRKVGGFADGVGNTRKIVRGLSRGDFVACGDNYDETGSFHHVATIDAHTFPYPNGSVERNPCYFFGGVGVLVLNRNIEFNTQEKGERQIHKVVEVTDGGKIEVTKDDVKVTSYSGKQVCFDKCGNILFETQLTPEKPSWMKYFFLMGKEERQAVKLWFAYVLPTTKRQSDFLKIVRKALNVVNYDYQIATIEPSLTDNERIFYKEGERVANRFPLLSKWKWKAKEFAPAWGSDLATLYELFLWYAYRIATDLWSIEYVCDDSSSIGNFVESPDSSLEFEVTGKRKIGGFADGVSNTSKLVAHEGFFAECGSCYHSSGEKALIANVNYIREYYFNFNTTGVLVLRHNPEH